MSTRPPARDVEAAATVRRRPPWWTRDGVPFVVAIVLGCAPIVVSVVWAIANKEWFAGDRSIMGVFTHDVFSRNTPLLGTVSTMGNYSGAEGSGSVHHLGPAQFWMLAVPNWVTGEHPAGLLVGALVVNCGAVALVAVFVRRRLGTVAAAVGTLVCTVLAYGLGPSLLRDIWTPFLGLWPLLALVVLVWSLIEGDHVALPWAALASGFLAQIELMFVGPALVLSVAGVAGLFIRRRTLRKEAAESGASPPRRLGVVLVASEAVAVFMWWPVALQQVTGDPGNLTLLVRAIQHGTEKAGPAFVWNNVVAQMSFPPVWVSRATTPFDVGQSPSILELLSAAIFFGGLLAVTRAAWRRRRSAPAVWAMVITSYPVLIAGIVNLMITPKAGVIGLQYRRWLWPFGAYLWAALLVGAGSWAIDQPWADRARGRAEDLVERGLATTAALALAALVVVPASIGQHTPPSDDVRDNPVVLSMWPDLRDALPEETTYVDFSGAVSGFGVGPEVIRRLLVDGYTVRVPSFSADSYGSFRVLSEDRPARQALQLVSGDHSLAPSWSPRRLIAAGRADGRSATDYVRLADQLLRRLRAEPKGSGVVLTAAGFDRLHQKLSEESERPEARTEALLEDPTRAMFDETVLRLHVAGEVRSSPITREEARRLVDAMEGVRVLAFLNPPPDPPPSTD